MIHHGLADAHNMTGKTRYTYVRLSKQHKENMISGIGSSLAANL